MSAAAETRHFFVHPAHHRGEGHVIADAADFQEAAFAFVECWSPAPEGDGEVRLIVCDCETGRQQCFRIDLGTGETASCDAAKAA